MQKEILNDNTDITVNSKQIDILKQNFPQCFDKKGDFIVHKMEEVIGDSGLELSKESYSLNWLGKSYARLLANENPRTLLKEDKEHNTKEQNKESQNLLIKGDNLEVLKHLSNAYAESIKMIYIDPPYNTGSDGFVYNDDRKFRADELSRLAGVDMDEARRILEFTQSKANSHSAWLTFMYPRLYVARHLLEEDGVIFISIDDNEQAQLKLLCDEVFGEENFVADFIIRSNPRGSQASKYIAVEHEYIFSYSKNLELSSIEGYEKNKEEQSEYELEDDDGKYRLLGLRQRGGAWKREDRPDMYYPIFIDPQTGNVSLEKTEIYCKESLPKRPTGEDSRWTWGKTKFLKDKHLLVGKKVNRKEAHDFWDIFRKDHILKNGEVARKKPRSIFDEKEVNYQNGGNEIKELFGSSEIFNYPKPTFLIKKCIEMLNMSDDLVLDFFAGSGTTAHAVMRLNAEDNGNRKFITVQIDEPTDPKSEAYKADYKSIFDITKARIEKAAQKIADEKPEYKGDLGFKIFETTPIWDGYLDDIEELKEDTILFDGSKLNDGELEVLLTTWKVYDGMKLTQELESINFASYQAYMGEGILYLVHSGFNTEALKILLELLDNDKSFEPSRVVMFGYNFSSKSQRELDEALSSFANKKSIELDLVVRY